MDQLRCYRLLLWMVGLAALAGSGCAEGPFSGWGSYNPWVRHRWAEEEKKYGKTLPTRVEELGSIRKRAAKMNSAQHEQISQQLVSALESEKNSILRVEMVKTLGALPTSAAAQGIRAAQSDAGADVRIAACQAWGRRGGTEAVESLAAILGSDTDADVRLAATRQLGRFRVPAAERALGIALDDRDHPELQYRAVQSLKSISGRDYGNNLTAWRQYVRGESPSPQKKPNLVERLRDFF